MTQARSRQRTPSLPSAQAYSRLGKLLLDARDKAGLSQKAVADTLGYGTAQIISDWERGLRSPPAVIIRKLVRIYDIPMEEFFEVLLAERSLILERKLRRDLGIK